MGEVFVVVEVQDVIDAEGFAAYQQGARGQLPQYGGVVVGRGGAHHEGAPPFGPLMIQKWPSEAAFLDWQNSDDYRPLKERRLASVKLRFGIVPAS